MIGDPACEQSDAPARDIIVIGASAGGVQVLQTLMRGFDPNLAASVFVVVHIAPTAESLLPSLLTAAGPLPAEHPRDGQQFEHGRIYVAPPDHARPSVPSSRPPVRTTPITRGP